MKDRFFPVQSCNLRHPSLFLQMYLYLNLSFLPPCLCFCWDSRPALNRRPEIAERRAREPG